MYMCGVLKPCQVEDSVKEALLPTGIDVQSRKYRTEEDPKSIPDFFVSAHHYDIDVTDVLLHFMQCVHTD